MKILKRGDDWKLVVKCERVTDAYGFAYGNEADFCGSELEIEASDIRKHPWHKYPDYSGVDYGVRCPVCGNFIAVKEKLIPVNVRSAAKETSKASGYL